MAENSVKTDQLQWSPGVGRGEGGGALLSPSGEMVVLLYGCGLAV